MIRFHPMVGQLTLLATLLFGATTTASAQTYSYDGSGRVSQVTYADGTTIAYSYDAAGNAVSSNVTPEPPAAGGGGGGCFIATAAYGSRLHPHVQDLRDFRDDYLLTNAPGRMLNQAYLYTSPPIARVIAEHAWLRFLTRVLLTPIVLVAVYPRTALVLVMLVIALRARRRWQRRLRTA